MEDFENKYTPWSSAGVDVPPLSGQCQTFFNLNTALGIPASDDCNEETFGTKTATCTGYGYGSLHCTPAAPSQSDKQRQSYQPFEAPSGHFCPPPLEAVPSKVVSLASAPRRSPRAKRNDASCTSPFDFDVFLSSLTVKELEKLETPHSFFSRSKFKQFIDSNATCASKEFDPYDLEDITEEDLLDSRNRFNAIKKASIASTLHNPTDSLTSEECRRSLEVVERSSETPRCTTQLLSRKLSSPSSRAAIPLQARIVAQQYSPVILSAGQIAQLVRSQVPLYRGVPGGGVQLPVASIGVRRQLVWLSVC